MITKPGIQQWLGSAPFPVQDLSFSSYVPGVPVAYHKP